MAGVSNNVAVREKWCDCMNSGLKSKKNLIGKILVALIIAGLLVSVEGVCKIIAYADADYPFPGEMEVDKTITVVSTDTSYGGLLVVFCASETDAQNALAFEAHASADYSRFGEVKSGSSVTAPESIAGINGTVSKWILKDSNTVVLSGSSSYELAAYYPDEIIINKPTYNIYCAYGDDADRILHEYFSSGNDNFLSGFGNNVTVRETAPSQITVYRYDVDSWTKKGEDSATSSNIAVYQAVYEGGISCIPGDDVEADAYEETEEFSLANASDTATIALPTAGEAGFSRIGYKLAGWEVEQGSDDYIQPGAEHELYPGEYKQYFAAWTPKTEVTLNITVDTPVHDDEDISSKISVQKIPEAATGTPVLEYKLKASDDSAYSESEPTATGMYTVRATLEESEDYAMAEEIADFEVLSSTLEVSIQYKPGEGTGDTVNKSVTAELYDDYSKGQVTLLEKADFKRAGYKLAGWTDGKKNYDLGSVYTFPVDEDDTTASLSFRAVWERVPEVEVSIQYSPNGGTGDKVNKSETVKISDDYSTGQITLLDKVDFSRSGYVLKGWTDGKKTYDLGSVYTFSVKSDETSKSLAFDAVWSGKEEGSVEIELKKSTYWVGTKIEYDIKKNSEGEVTVEYKKKGEADSKYTTKVPKEPGKYTVRATLEETDDYSADEAKGEFEIEYLTAPNEPYKYQEIKDGSGALTDLKVIPVDGFKISLSQTDFGPSVLYSNAKGGSVYLQRESDAAITDKIAIKDYYIEDKSEITVKKEVLYGTELEVSFSSASPAEKKLLYKKSRALDNAYSETVPTTPGDYTVMLSAPAVGFYPAVSKTAEFSIVYLETNPGKVSLDGKGENGWFRSDVTINAPQGYKISNTGMIGSFTDTITWSKDIKQLYYQRIQDGAITNAITFDSEVKIDKVTPAAVFPEGLNVADITKPVTVFMDELTFTIKDDNLKEVTVDGEKQTFTGKECVIRFAGTDELKSHKVVARDLAGNEYSFTLALASEWVKTRTVPVGKAVSLKSNTDYSFAGGNRYVIEGNNTDNIVYSGGSKFYVRKDMSCIFKQEASGQ